MFQYLFQGGPVMWVLLLCSVTSLAIILLKTYELLRLRSCDNQQVQSALEAIAKGNLSVALTSVESGKHPAAQILTHFIQLQVLSLPKDERDAELARRGAEIVRALESRLRGLAAIGYLSPLLGLLGTVTGMIKAFMQIQGAAGAQVLPSLLAGGIWEALLTTAFGLMVAIPSMAAFYYFEGKVDDIRARMKGVAVRAAVLFSQSQASKTSSRENRAYGV